MALLSTLGLAALTILSSPSSRAADLELITDEGQRHILGPPAAPMIGSTTPTVTLVEYFDYNCPYCKALTPTLKALLASDPHLALVYKDWPVLGPVSRYAAQCVLAAKWQDHYVQAHDALIAGPRLTQNGQVDALLQKAGIDMLRLKGDLDRHAGTIDTLLQHNDAEARALGLQGTPGILMGRQLPSRQRRSGDLENAGVECTKALMCYRPIERWSGKEGLGISEARPFSRGQVIRNTLSPRLGDWHTKQGRRSAFPRL